jgi:hypothetical protein
VRWAPIGSEREAVVVGGGRRPPPTAHSIPDAVGPVVCAPDGG